MARNAKPDEEFCQTVQNILGRELSGHIYRQTLPRELIHHHEHPNRASIPRAFHSEVIRTHMIPSLGPPPHA